MVEPRSEGNELKHVLFCYVLIISDGFLFQVSTGFGSSSS